MQVSTEGAGSSVQNARVRLAQVSSEKFKHANAGQTVALSEIQTPQLDSIVPPSSFIDSIQPGGTATTFGGAGPINEQ